MNRDLFFNFLLYKLDSNGVIGQECKYYYQNRANICTAINLYIQESLTAGKKINGKVNIRTAQMHNVKKKITVNYLLGKKHCK